MAKIISIIIPFRDNSKLLQKCVLSVLERTIYQDYEILLVDNQSSEKATKFFLQHIQRNKNVKILTYNKLFNFSAINNYAVKIAKGQHVLFLNNDTEVISPDWLDKMLECFRDEKIGVVGAKLLYPDGKIQHIGVEIHPQNGPVHTSRLAIENEIDFSKPLECLAVTAACMLTKKNLFEEVGGFDEKNLAIAYNDVDYCLKLRELGYKTICTPHARLYHHESASRKSDILSRFFNRKRYKEFLKEKDHFNKKWPQNSKGVELGKIHRFS